MRFETRRIGIGVHSEHKSVTSESTIGSRNGRTGEKPQYLGFPRGGTRLPFDRIRVRHPGIDPSKMGTRFSHSIFGLQGLRRLKIHARDVSLIFVRSYAQREDLIPALCVMRGCGAPIRSKGKKQIRAAFQCTVTVYRSVKQLYWPLESG